MSGRDHGHGVRIRDAEVEQRRVDVDVVGTTIVAVSPTGTTPWAMESVDARGGALLPGLHDHHVHLLAGAAAMDSVDVSVEAVVDQRGFVDALRRAHRQLAPGRWLRAVGYHESVAGDLDASVLDQLGIDRPMRIQHRTGAMWFLNGPAIAATGADDVAADGRLFRHDDWLRERVPHEPPDLAELGRRLLSYGITGVTDLTPTSDAAGVELVADAARRGLLPDVTITGSAALDPGAAPSLPRGPVKIVIDDHELPSLDDLAARVGAARSLRRPVAFHCVTRAALVLAVAVLHDVGSIDGDRIEHAAVVPIDLFDDLRQLGITVVTQPNFVAERGDAYLRDVDAVDVPDLYRCRSLREAGIPVAFGSDLPYGSADPWRTITAAVERRTPSGAVIGPGERVTPEMALQAWLGHPGAPTTPRRIAAGTVADLVLLDRSLRAQLDAPTTDAVQMTMVAGRLRWSAT